MKFLFFILYNSRMFKRTAHILIPFWRAATGWVCSLVRSHSDTQVYEQPLQRHLMVRVSKQEDESVASGRLRGRMVWGGEAFWWDASWAFEGGGVEAARYLQTLSLLIVLFHPKKGSLSKSILFCCLYFLGEEFSFDLIFTKRNKCYTEHFYNLFCGTKAIWKLPSSYWLH